MERAQLLVHFATVLSPQIDLHGLTLELFDQLLDYVRLLIVERGPQDEVEYKRYAVESAWIMARNRGFYKKTLKPLVRRIFSPQSFLATHLGCLKNIVLCALLVAKKTKCYRALEFYRDEVMRLIYDDAFLQDCRQSLTKASDRFYFDGSGVVWINPKGEHCPLFRIGKPI